MSALLSAYAETHPVPRPLGWVQADGTVTCYPCAFYQGADSSGAPVPWEAVSVYSFPDGDFTEAEVTACQGLSCDGCGDALVPLCVGCDADLSVYDPGEQDGEHYLTCDLCLDDRLGGYYEGVW